MRVNRAQKALHKTVRDFVAALMFLGQIGSSGRKEKSRVRPVLVKSSRLELSSGSISFSTIWLLDRGHRVRLVVRALARELNIGIVTRKIQDSEAVSHRDSMEVWDIEKRVQPNCRVKLRLMAGAGNIRDAFFFFLQNPKKEIYDNSWHFLYSNNSWHQIAQSFRMMHRC